MDPVKQRAVQEAELFLETFLKELKILEDKVRASKILRSVCSDMSWKPDESASAI
jgi:hypothetical protein